MTRSSTGIKGKSFRFDRGILRQVEGLVGLTSSGLILIGLAILVWTLGLLAGARSVLLLTYGAIVVLALSWVTGRRRVSVEAKRSRLPTRVRVGNLVNVQLQMEARRRLTTVIVEESLPPALGEPVMVPIEVLPSGKIVEHVYTFAPKLRGVYNVGPLVATWSDPFGLTRKRVVLAEPTEIIVHPPTETVHDRVITRAWEDPPIRPPVSKPWPTGFEFYGMRDYVAGDDPRRIVWRATARTLDPVTGAGRYLVRESEQGITDRASLVLDSDVRNHGRGEPSETYETSVGVVASLGAKHLRDGFAVTVDMNGRRIVDALRGQRNRVRLLDELARVKLESVPLSKALERLAASARQDLHTVVVTPHLDEESARRLRLLLDRGASVLVALVLWEESDPDSSHRAAGLGCNVVEIPQGAPFEKAFRRVVGTGVRRER